MSTEMSGLRLNKRIEQSAKAGLRNAQRLLIDADLLQFDQPPATAYYLALIAQEECAQAIANGQFDRRKQDALYVRLAANGGFIPAAPLTNETVRTEMERTNRFVNLAENLLREDPQPGLDYDIIERAFRLLFTDLPIE